MSDTNQHKKQDGEVGHPEFIYFLLVDRHSTTRNDVHARMGMKDPMGKLKKMYSDGKFVPVNSLKFLFDGRRIDDDETPEQLDMEGNEVIEVHPDPSGGDERVTR